MVRSDGGELCSGVCCFQESCNSLVPSIRVKCLCISNSFTKPELIALLPHAPKKVVARKSEFPQAHGTLGNLGAWKSCLTKCVLKRAVTLVMGARRSGCRDLQLKKGVIHRVHIKT